jgi:hypothetical protein
MFPIQSDGSLRPASDVIQHSGSSVHPERQNGPHAHCILPDPTNRFAVAADLGLDKLLIYQMDLENGKLHRHTEVKVSPVAGPRHLTFHPNGQFAYLINELNSTLIAYRYDSRNGAFEELQTVPALPRDFKGENLCADIHISPSGKYLYGSNRGHDSIVCFLIDQMSGELVYRSHTLSGGREPRNRECLQTVERAYWATKSLLKENSHITAIVAMHTTMAVGAIRALQEMNRKVPEDCSIMGVPVGEESELIIPPLTGIEWSGHEIGHQAARMLIREIKGTSLEPEQILVPPRLKLCQSTALASR